MSTLRRHEGYLLIDHRMAPGSDPNPDPAQSVRAGALFESATITCSHCNAIIVLNPDRSRARHYCASCDHYVCDTLACIVTCDPMAKRIDRLRAQALTLLAREGDDAHG